MEERRLELKVGALLAAALLGGAGILYLLGELRLGGGARIQVDFAHSGGVPEGAPVKLAGVRVGRVTRLSLLPGRRAADGSPLPVRMELELDRPVFAELKSDARAGVATQGPLGEPFLELEPGSTSARPLEPGAALRGVDPPRMDLLSAKLMAFLDGALRLLGDEQYMPSLVATAARLAAKAEAVIDENRPRVGEAARDLTAAARELRAIAQATSQALGERGDARQILADLRALSAQLRRDVPPLTRRAREAADGAAALAAAFSPDDPRRAREALARYEKAGETLQEVARRADRLLAGLENGQGTAGALLRDPRVYEDLKALVTDLKSHPWKILWKE
jgi:phospholipid/cholesterol/gamma-HCH transport system substrate-binding protein